MNEKLKYWIALSMVDGVGYVSAKKLMAEFESPENLFKASKRELGRIKGLFENRADNIIDAISAFSDWILVEEEIKKTEKLGFDVLTLNDPAYPESLLNIYNPPLILYVKGEILPEDSLSVAIVGTRIPDRYGRTITERLSGELAARGITIVSGIWRAV